MTTRGGSVFVANTPTTQEFFSQENIAQISRRISENFESYYGQKYVIPNTAILSAMQTVYREKFDIVPKMNNLVIYLVFNSYKSEMDFQSYTLNLDKKKVVRWDPELGIRQYPPIKLSNRRYTRGWTSINY